MKNRARLMKHSTTEISKIRSDRYHNEFVAAKEKANDVHSKIEEMMVDVNEARDKLNAAREERKSWMVDHNKLLRLR